MDALPPTLFEFLRELRANNERSWFEINKDRYRSNVRDPMLAFIADFAEPLSEISPHFVADPRPKGGSLFRIHRDIRFSRDKSPYKSNAGAHFRHAAGKGAHAPGFYLHLEPGNCFAGCGIWRPDRPAIDAIRASIDGNRDEWIRITGERSFRETFRFVGEGLKRPPQGFEAAHPLIQDLKRKDFVALADLTEDDATRSGFIDRYASIARRGAGFVRFLCKAVGAPF